jgi:UDP-N-acetylglucosamine transferase subunit ALG13
MILVTVGSAEQPYTRLLAAMDVSADRLGEPVVMQCGQKPYPGRHTQCLGYLTFGQFHRLARDSRLIIGHASMGPVLVARRYGKPFIVVPRDPAFQETFNDHQFQTARALEGTSRMIEVVFDIAGLEAAIRRAQAKADQGETYEPHLRREPLIAAIRAAAEGREVPGP